MLRLVPFQNKVAEIRVEYLGRQFFLTHVPPPPLKVCFGGRICAPMILVMPTQIWKTFKTLFFVHYLSSHRFDRGLM